MSRLCQWPTAIQHHSFAHRCHSFSFEAPQKDGLTQRAVALDHLPLAAGSFVLLSLPFFDPRLFERKAAAAAWTGGVSNEQFGKTQPFDLNSGPFDVRSSQRTWDEVQGEEGDLSVEDENN